MSIVAGGNDFVDMIKLLGNQSELERRITALNEAKAQAEATIALAGKASEIVKLREQIDADVAEAKRMLEYARGEAEAVIAEGKRTAEKTRLEATLLLDAQKIATESARKHAAELVAEAQGKMAEANAAFATAAMAAKEAENAKALAQQEAEMSREAKARFEARLAAIRDVQEQCIEALSLI
jgi:hypothetical protein